MLWLVIKHIKTLRIYVRGSQELRLRAEEEMREKAKLGHLYCFTGLVLPIRPPLMMKLVFFLLLSMDFSASRRLHVPRKYLAKKWVYI